MNFEYLGTTYELTPAHAAADKLPFIDKSFEELVESMKANGYDSLHPILLDEELDIIMAGRRRELAAFVAGIKPIYTARKFKSEEDRCNFVIREELRSRRHLTESQIAMFTVEITDMANRGGKNKSEPKKTVSELASMTGVSARTITDAKAVKDNAPDLVDKVKSGEISVKKAATIARDKNESAPVPIQNDSFVTKPWMPNYEDAKEKSSILKEAEAALQDALIALNIARAELRKIQPTNMIGTIISVKQTLGDLDQSYKTIEEIAEMLEENIPSHPCPNCVGLGKFEDKVCKYCNSYGIFDQKHHDGLEYRWKETSQLYQEMNNG